MKYVLCLLQQRGGDYVIIDSNLDSDGIKDSKDIITKPFQSSILYKDNDVNERYLGENKFDDGDVTLVDVPTDSVGFVTGK